MATAGIMERQREEERGDRLYLRELAYGGAELLGGFALGFAEPFGGCAPFGIALCAGAGTGVRGLCCLFGTMTGYLLSRGLDRGLRYCAAALMVFAVSFVFRDTPAMERSWFLPLSTALLTGICGSLVFFEGASPLLSLARLLSECLFASASVEPFRLVRREERELSPGEKKQRRIGLALIFCGGIMALCRLRFFGGFIPGHALAALSVLLWAWAGGSTKGSVAGVVMGLCTDLSATSPTALTLSFALGGLLGGSAKGKKRSVFALLFSLGSALPLLTDWQSRGLFAAIELFLGICAFLLLPKKTLSALSEALVPWEGENGEEQLRRYAVERNTALARSLRGLYETLGQEEGAEDEEDMAAVYDRAAECVCGDCIRKELCWHGEYLQMLSALQDATELVRRRGRLSAEELPRQFRESCIHPEAFAQSVNGEIRVMGYRRQLRSRLEDNRRAAFGQLRTLAEALEQQARELGKIRGSEDSAEQKLYRYLHARELQGSVSALRDERGRLRLSISGECVSALSAREELTEELSRVTGVRLSRIRQGSEGTLVFAQRETLTAQVSIATARKQGESVSGDRGSWFRTERGRLCLLLSDGMGSGESAEREALRTVRAIESLLRSGVEPEEALRLVNGLMLLRHGDSWAYATIDLATLDLNSGEAAFYKFGAAPSYVRVDGEVKRVRGVSLAAGILSGEDEEREVLRTTLQSGDWLLLCSDGVASEQSDGWLRRLLRDTEQSPQSFARTLVEEAERQYGRCDDMTVLALQLRENGE